MRLSRSLIVSLALLILMPAWGQRSNADGPLRPQDLFAKLSQMISAGDAKSAKTLALGNPVSPPEDTEKDENYGTYLLHLGWIELTLGNHSAARGFLLESRRFWPESMWLAVYLLQACQGLGDSECVWQEYRLIPEWYLAQQEGLAFMAAESATASGHLERALGVLSRMRAIAPASKRVFVSCVLMQARIGLGSKVLGEMMDSFKEDFQPSLAASDYGSLLAHVLDKGFTGEVLQALEIALVRFPEEPSLHALQALAYESRGETRRAASSLLRAASLDRVFAHDAAQLLARIGETELALVYNAKVPDRIRQLEQRAILYLEQRDYERLTALEKPLKSAGLLERDDMRYALAFSHFQGGELGAALGLLQGIEDDRIFAKASVLRTEIAKQCRSRFDEGCP